MPRVTPAAGGAEYRRNFPVISDPACLTAPRQPLVAAAALDHVLALALLCNMVGPAMGEALPTGDEGAPAQKGPVRLSPYRPRSDAKTEGDYRNPASVPGWLLHAIGFHHVVRHARHVLRNRLIIRVAPPAVGAVDRQGVVVLARMRQSGVRRDQQQAHRNGQG